MAAMFEDTDGESKNGDLEIDIRVVALVEMIAECAAVRDYKELVAMLRDRRHDNQIRSEAE